MRGGGPNCCADAEADGGGPDPVAVAPSVIAVAVAPSVIAVGASVIAVAASVIAVGAPVIAVDAPCVIAASSNPCGRVCGSDGNRASRQHDGKYKGTRSTCHFSFLSLDSDRYALEIVGRVQQAFDFRVCLGDIQRRRSDFLLFC
jgi:hypothetical protein